MAAFSFQILFFRSYRLGRRFAINFATTKIPVIQWGLKQNKKQNKTKQKILISSIRMYNATSYLSPGYVTRKPARPTSGHLARNDTPSMAVSRAAPIFSRIMPTSSSLNTRIRNPPKNIPAPPIRISPPKYAKEV